MVNGALWSYDLGTGISPVLLGQDAPAISIMSRRRFFAPRNAFSRTNVTLATDEAKYLREVLRLRVGEQVHVFNGEGQEFQCEIEESRRDSARLRVIEEVSAACPESALQIILCVALLKGEKFDLVVQKATELGVQRIVPVTTKFADIRLRDASDSVKRVARWQRIALEAAKQSGRAVVPQVDAAVSFEDLIANESSDVRIMFAERDGEPLAEATAAPATPKSVTTLVGSEGGWSDGEIAAAREAGWSIVTLGGRTLRAETAAIAVVTLIQHLWGDLR